jgi:hypothetical protein
MGNNDRQWRLNNTCVWTREIGRSLRLLIRLGYDIQFEIPATVAMVGMLHVHPSRIPDL